MSNQGPSVCYKTYYSEHYRVSRHINSTATPERFQCYLSMGPDPSGHPFLGVDKSPPSSLRETGYQRDPHLKSPLHLPSKNQSSNDWYLRFPSSLATTLFSWSMSSISFGVGLYSRAESFAPLSDSEIFCLVCGVCGL